MFRRLRTFVALSASLALAGSVDSVARADATSAAADASKHSVALYVEGPRASEAHDDVAAAFPANATFIDDATLKSALKKEGQPMPAGATLAFAKAARKPTLTRFGKAATSVGAEAIVVAQVKNRKGGGQEVLLLYIDAGTSDAREEKTIALDSSFTDSVKTAFDAEITAMKPAELASSQTTDAAPKPEDHPKTDDTTGPGRPANTFGREILDASLAFDLGGRFFNFSDPISANLRDYKVFGAPGIAIAAGVYPMAALKVPVLRDIGIVGDFRIAFALGSETKDGTKVSTSWNRFDAGLRYRLPLAKQEKKGDKAVVLGARGMVGRDAFSLSATGDLGNQAPGVAYFFLRGGLDATFPAGPIRLTAYGDYLGALSAGSVYDRMRGSTIGGFDVGGTVAVPIALGFEARVSGEYIRWFYAFDPIANDPYVAGGALDQYVHIELGPAYVF